MQEPYSCFGYQTCSKGVKKEFNCTSDKPWYDPDANACSVSPPFGCHAECLSKSDGQKYAVGCFSYFECRSGAKAVSNCSNNSTWFDPVSSSCSISPPFGCDIDCLGKVDGTKYSEGCFGYFECTAGVKTVSECPTNTPWFIPNQRSCGTDPPSGCHLDCLDKVDGDKYKSGCYSYFTCMKGSKTEFNCSTDKPWFDFDSNSCSMNPPLGCDAECLEQEGSKIKIDDDCYTYFLCSNGRKVEMSCATGQPYFDPSSGTCLAVAPTGCQGISVICEIFNTFLHPQIRITFDLSIPEDF